MIIENNEEQINYLTKMRIKKVKQKPEKQMAFEFVRDFNKEAKKQNSKWFAEFKEHLHKGFNQDEPFILLHIHKRLVNGWWIFKNITTISLHIGCKSDHYYSFVVDDYVFSKYGQDKIDELRKYIPEFKNILDKIPEQFWLMPKGEEKNFELKLTQIKKDLVKLEAKI